MQFCHFTTTAQVQDFTFFCDINNLVTASRCAVDGMGSVAFEVENPSIDHVLTVDGFYIEDSHIGGNATNTSFVLQPESVAVVHIEMINALSWAISELVIREGAASLDTVQDLTIETEIAFSLSEGMTRLEVDLLLTPFPDGLKLTLAAPI